VLPAFIISVGMLIREYTERDFDALRAIHAAQGFDYALPDLRNPLFVTKLVLSTKNPDAALAPGFSMAHASAQTGEYAALKGGATQDGLATIFAEAENPNARREGNCGPADSHGAPADRPGRILGAALLRLTAEAYLLLDPRAGTPRERWQWLLALHAAAERDAWQRGLEDVHAWLPPPIAKKFGRRLERLGWLRDDSWTPYCKKLG